MATLSATACQVQEEHSTVKERSVLCATPVGRREVAERPELDIESLAMSVERKSCASTKVRRAGIFTQEEMSMHKMWQEKL